MSSCSIRTDGHEAKGSLLRCSANAPEHETSCSGETPGAMQLNRLLTRTGSAEQKLAEAFRRTSALGAPRCGQCFVRNNGVYLCGLLEALSAEGIVKWAFEWSCTTI